MLHHRGRSTLLIATTTLIIIVIAVVSSAANTSVVDAIHNHHRHPMIAFSTATSSSAAASVGLRQLFDNTIICRRNRFSVNKTLRMMSSSSQQQQQQQQHDDGGGEANNSLSQQLATRLIHGKTNNSRSMKASIAIAGGGSSAISSIASTTGASSLLLEGIVTYDRLSFAEFVSANLNDDNIICDNDSDNDNNKSSSSSNDQDNKNKSSSSSSSFSFCSAQAAILLSQSALSRGIQLSPNFHDRSLYCVGVGCASVLYGGRLEDDGTDDGDGGRVRTSKAYIAISSLREGTIVTEIKLEDDSNNNDGAKNKNKRSRAEEETVLSNLILSSMIKYKEQLKEDNDDYQSIIKQILDREGDGITSSKLHNNAMMPSRLPAEGARQIIEGNANIASILPVTDTTDKEDNSSTSSSSSSSSFHMETTLYDKQIPFPNDILIVPGSYNPPHHGHIGLANAAVLALRRLRQIEEKDGSRYSSLESFASNASSSSSSSLAILKNVWDTVDQHTDNTYDPTVLFEMSVTNADKPPLDPSEVERRINFFSLLPVESMPNDWGVILTNAPLFSQKTSLLEQVMNNNASSSSSGRRMTFVLGTDTFVRIINPKYYNNSIDNMIDALVEMKEKGVHFIVGGRLEQQQQQSSMGDDGSIMEKKMMKFINGEEEVKSLPLHVREMFTLLSEEEFRLDVSSTEIRKQMQT